ncbi:hypothetical protein A2U01_0055741, partial [Trifolium medium]|nr:hypothetical protein [Trifolium medium]
MVIDADSLNLVGRGPRFDPRNCDRE